MALNIDPPEGNFPATGGNAVHSIINLTDNRMAYKTKCSNNDCYRVTPVYGFIEKQGKMDLTIIRLAGPPREDKFVIQYCEVPDEEDDPKAPFQAGAQEGEVILPVKAE
ncbi:hypothetical protein AB6A40_006671 [Gnathostoma spinigerum]|uniref:MSP domain-containing protein n=1 Tax=Gnathostoma spinigerum TaxID=75299 RepID=A0ABD6EL83_9BILA